MRKEGARHTVRGARKDWSCAAHGHGMNQETQFRTSVMERKCDTRRREPMSEPFATPDFPTRITIEISSLCNLSCIMCPRRHASKPGGLMSRELFQRIVEEVGVHEVHAVVPFFRGEPLLHPGFLDMMTLLRQKTSARIQLATNALLLTPATAKALLDLRIDFISFSLDAIRKETYERIRLGGDFNRTMENVHAFLRMREGMFPCFTHVQVSATEGPENEKEMPDFIRYWKDRADRVRIYPRHSDGGLYGKLSGPEHRRPESVREPCTKPFTDLVIYTDGQAALCNHDWDRGGAERFGSVEEKGIEGIWRSQVYLDIREKHLRQRWNELQPCRHCDHWQGSSGAESGVGMLIES